MDRTRREEKLTEETLDTMVANFMETIGNLSALECTNWEELADCIEHIGMRIRNESCVAQMRGHTFIAEKILHIATNEV